MNSETVTAAGINLHSEELFKSAYGGRVPAFYSNLLGEVLEFGQPGKIVDLGAGLGLFVELAQSWGLDVVGLEGSAYAIEEAKVRAPGIKIAEHDLGNQLPFEDETVANFVLNQVVEHIDPQRLEVVLKECHRALLPGGKIFIYSPSRLNLAEQAEPTHINMMLPSELQVAVAKAGFTTVHRPDYGLWFYASGSRIVSGVSKILIRLLPRDWVSATANVIAEKR